jgi:alpha/beta superfamily hydrolase
MIKNPVLCRVVVQKLFFVATGFSLRLHRRDADATGWFGHLVAYSGIRADTQVRPYELACWYQGSVMEEAVSIPGPGITLEGRLLPGAAPGGAVITHPHPLFGGDMSNNVVLTAVRALAARGMTALRFNFRGVGRSTGTYGGGLEEADDVAAALAFLKSRTPGPHYVVGYSFGAAVAGRALLQGLVADGAVCIAPPIAFMDLTFLPRVPGLRLILVGDRDELCPLASLQALMAASRPSCGETVAEIRVIAGADHFFSHGEAELFRELRDLPL